jgi:trehalose 6-phosphate synthase/phosphatase
MDRLLVFEAYKAAEKRILFLDYDGTLVPFNDQPDDSRLDNETRQILVKLLSDIKNCIFIISGRQRKFLSEQFHGINIGLIAEHGLLSKEAYGDWIKIAPVDTSWKEPIMNIFQEFIILFPGSFTEEKESSVAYHYRLSGRDVGRKVRPVIRKKILLFQPQFPDLELLEGNNVFEVKPNCYNKGLAADTILRKGNFDFILAAGDDLTDEQLFAAVNPEGFTIKIGRSPTLARIRFNSQKKFIEFLKELLQLR